MMGKGWTIQVATAAGAAAGTGAAQLGLGYGLGVVVWPVAPTPDDSVWLGSLGWATWIAASATVFGAVIAARLRDAQAPRLSGPWRFALAVSAAVGALLTVVLVAVPARSAVRSDTFAPEMIAGRYAVIGVVLGLIVAYWAVVSRAVAANLIATAGYLWALAAAGIVVELTVHRESATYLSSWQFAELSNGARYGTIYWPSALLTLLAALIIGMIAAWPSARGGDLGIGTAASGTVGPLLVAAAFLMLGPQLTPALGQLESAYLMAPYAVLAGLAGSALVVASGQRSARRRAARIARIHRPAPPAATGIAAVPAQPSAAQDDDTPPMGLPHVSTTPKQRSGRVTASAASRPAPPDQASTASDQTSTVAQTPDPADSLPAGPGSAGASDRPGWWGRLRRGGRGKPSSATGGSEATTPEPSVEPTPGRARPPAEAGAAPRGAAPDAGPVQIRPTTRTPNPAPPPAQNRPTAPSAEPAAAKRGVAEAASRTTVTKSTVAAPPQAPPIAKINPPRESAAKPGPNPARPSSKTTPAKAAPSKPTSPAETPSAKPKPQPRSDKPD